ncbi:hypothetical protein AAFC00_007182 [Neodothiora populina]|uniref:C2H2-type domain-containing protein n=1 Tax=Neodothiora populina TaxID=2781224 RepID=A0ABR3PHG4_9PEZI
MSAKVPRTGHHDVRSFVTQSIEPTNDVIDVDAVLDPDLKRETRRSGAPSPEIDVAQEQLQWVAFDAGDFEDRNEPLMFLSPFTVKNSGRRTIRSKAIIPEEFITRVPYKSPCFPQQDEKGARVSADLMERLTENHRAAAAAANLVDLLTVDHHAASAAATKIANSDTNEDDTLDMVRAPGSDSVQWDNDPSFQLFLSRLDQEEHLRHHRFHPLSKYTSYDEENCTGCLKLVLPKGVSRPAKVAPALRDNHELWRRFWQARCSLDEEDVYSGRFCPVCMSRFEDITSEPSPSSHMESHRASHMKATVRKVSHAKEQNAPVDPIIMDSPFVQHLRFAKGDAKHKATRLERMCNLAENEVLEREEYCRICLMTFDYGSAEVVEHYRDHVKEDVKQDDDNFNAARLPAMSFEWSEADLLLALFSSSDNVKSNGHGKGKGKERAGEEQDNVV